MPDPDPDRPSTEPPVTRAALVTGASSGIGYAIADALGADGYSLTLTSRRPKNLEPAAAALREKGYEIVECIADVIDANDVARVVSEHEAAWGRLDVLVNSAGGGIMAPMGALDDVRVDRQLDLNLRSVILFVHRSLDLLRRTATPEAPARVINVSSLAGVMAAPFLSVYGAAKHGVVGFTETMNAELAGANIRATALCPEMVDTPLTELPAIRDRMSAEEMITVADLIGAVRFLVRLSPATIVSEISFRNAVAVDATR
jgi:NAD(P)-dependent dehydrogenase (short-subunit alcohol dehydrogenase family)